MAATDRTQQILPGGQSAAPYTYPIPASTVFQLLTVRAVFDGSGAGTTWLPCVQLVSDAGALMAQTEGTAVAAGGSADVTFTPFLGSSAAATSGLTYVAELATYSVAGAYSYVIPSGCVALDVYVTGAGGGAGGGASGGTGNETGGSGGGGGATVHGLLNVAALTSPISVTVGTGGAGGAGGAGIANGSDGTDGTASAFGILTGYAGGRGFGGRQAGANLNGGGGGGVGGSAVGATPGLPGAANFVPAIAGQGASGLGAQVQGVQSEWGGAAACNPNGTPPNGDGGDSLYGGPAGGCGGGWNHSALFWNGAAGGGTGKYSIGGGGAGGTSGVAPTAGADGTFTGPCGNGGGGGGGTTTGGGTGAHGGKGGPGAGGGGGGVGNGTGGAGGQGGDGLVIVLAYVPA